MSQYRDDTPKVSDELFIGLLWSGVSVSLAFVLFRLFIRFEHFRKVFADDILVVVAWLLLLLAAILWSIEKSSLYLQYDVLNGVVSLTPDGSKQIRNFNWCALVIEATFYACLWSLKLSFLIFLRRLGEKVTGLRLLWWLVTGLVLVSFFTCIGLIPYRCLVPPLEVLDGMCNSISMGRVKADDEWVEKCPPAYANKSRQTNLHYTCTIDVVTDAAVIAVPIKLLWNVRIGWQKKLALAGLLSLSAIVIAFSIIRIGVVSSYNNVPDTAWLFFWSSLEMSLAIMVACLASFRQLFTKQESRPYKHPIEDTPLSPWGSRLSLRLPLAFFRKKIPVNTFNPSTTPSHCSPAPSSLIDPHSQTFSTGLKSPRDHEEIINAEDHGLRASRRRSAARSLPETFSELSLDFDDVSPIPIIDSGHRGTMREKLEHIER